jgi:hypothetical protein
LDDKKVGERWDSPTECKISQGVGSATLSSPQVEHNATLNSENLHVHVVICISFLNKQRYLFMEAAENKQGNDRVPPA